MTLAEKIESIMEKCNELAIGYNDSGCFWHFTWGERGSGNMIDGFGWKYNAEIGTFEESVDEFLEHLTGDPAKHSRDVQCL